MNPIQLKLNCFWVHFIAIYVIWMGVLYVTYTGTHTRGESIKWLPDDGITWYAANVSNPCITSFYFYKQ